MTVSGWASLFKLMNYLGPTISDSKLVAPSTKVVCWGFLINTEDGNVSILREILCQIKDTVR